ncbi:MAG: hypothetical protein KC662_04625 [Candidatus Magasanikbacteria bacterium]|nr:hypothetical protein [Candidatus Magasanikbacteria bacterium]
MNKYLSSLSLAIIGTLTIGSNVLAAPGVVYKKQLNVPTVPVSIINQLKQMNWAYPSKTSTDSQGLSTIKNVELLSPELQSEIECGDTSYRMWTFYLDGQKTQKTHDDIDLNISKLSHDTFVGRRFVFEARKNDQVKWQIEPNDLAVYTLDRPTPSADAFFGCSGNDAVIENVFTAPRSSRYKRTLRVVTFKDFTKDSTWNTVAAYDSGVQNNAILSLGTQRVDGIKQIPGHLLFLEGRLYGDSRPVTIEPQRGIVSHGMPHYRDLRMLPANIVNLSATFYRMHDGYAVKEDTRVLNNGIYELRTTYFRIHDGDARYSVIDSLPFDSINKSQLSRNIDGLVLSQTINGIVKRTLVHGLPSLNLSQTGSDYWESDYGVTAIPVWETSAQVYTRYMITDARTGKQQYWEATVNKN